jgi:ABC-type polysaccharide/polyol phosphate transport system ATPase subunit
MPYIKIDNVSLDIPVYEKTDQVFTNKILTLGLGGIISRHKRRPIIKALQDITLDIQDGDAVALVGQNGAGKSTLLRVIAGLFVPTRGRINTKGNISSLLNIGMGMDFELSGYDNIFTMGLLLGLTNRQIKNIRQEVIEFTELGEFINFPVKTYSAGMVIRLSFALATAIEPEILILDEGIGAGDVKFVQKARDRATKLYKKTSIMVVASHDETLIRNFCNKAVLLSRGRVIETGDVDKILCMYNEECKN